MSEQPSSPSGALNDETTAIPQDTPSTNAEPLVEMAPTLGTLGDTADPRNPKDSQLTPNLMVSTQSEDVQGDARMLIMFGEKLVPLVEWQRIELVDGRIGTMLFFDDTKWFIEPVGRKIIPR